MIGPPLVRFHYLEIEYVITDETDDFAIGIECIFAKHRPRGETWTQQSFKDIIDGLTSSAHVESIPPVFTFDVFSYA